MKQEDDIPADRWRGDAGTGALSSKKPIIIRLGDNWPACVSQECVGNSLLLIRLLAAYLIFMSSFLPGRSVRKRTIAHQLVNEEGKRNSLPPLLLLLLLLPPPTPPASFVSCLQFHLLQTRRDSGRLPPPLPPLLLPPPGC